MKIENLSVSEGDDPLNKERLIFFFVEIQIVSCIEFLLEAISFWV